MATVAPWALYRGRTLRMPGGATRLPPGWALPPILVARVVGNRLASEMLGVTNSDTRHEIALHSRTTPVAARVIDDVARLGLVM